MKENASGGEYVGEVYFDEEKAGGFWHKLEAFLESRYFLALVVVLVALISFFLGVFWNAKADNEPLRVYSSNESPFSDTSSESNPPGLPSTKEGTEQSAAAVLGTPENSEAVVASKNGTKYHYPWCPGAKQIAEKNKVTFSSIEEARAKGYTPAANCKGLK